MKKMLPLAVVLLISTLLNAQTAKKYSILSTGCSVSMTCNPGEFVLVPNEDDPEDSTVNIKGKCVVGALNYGVVYEDSRHSPVADDYTLEDHLKEKMAGQREFAFDCKGSMLGMKKAAPSADGSISIADEWESHDGYWYQVKGYTNGNVFVLLYVKNKGKLAATAPVKAFLDSFSFPAKK